MTQNNVEFKTSIKNKHKKDPLAKPELQAGVFEMYRVILKAQWVEASRILQAKAILIQVKLMCWTRV